MFYNIDMSLIQEYLQLTEMYKGEYGEKTILLMQNGAFYEVYAFEDINIDRSKSRGKNKYSGSNIEDFSDLCDLAVVYKKVPGGDNLKYKGSNVVNAGFKTHLIEKFIKILQSNGYTIVVYEETGDDPVKNTKIRSKTAIYSPGTFFYDEKDTYDITNNICCIWLENHINTIKRINNIYVGISVIDIYTGNSYIHEFSNEYMKTPSTFDDLERFLSIYTPSETIIITNIDKEDINNIVSFVNLKSKTIHIVDTNNETDKCSVRAKKCEKQTYQIELLQTFYTVTDPLSFMNMFYNYNYATQSFCYLLDFIYQHNPYLTKHIMEPVLETNSKHLLLANHSLKQLNIIDDNNYTGKYSSVLKMLNDCDTVMGRRKFAAQFLKPVTDEIYLKQEYDIIEYVIELKQEQLFDLQLSNICDINKIVRQIVLQKVTPKTLYLLYNTLDTIRNAYFICQEHIPLSQYLSLRVPDYGNLLDYIDKIRNYLYCSLLLDECKDIDNINKAENSFIKQGINADLDQKVNLLVTLQYNLETCRSYFNTLLNCSADKPFVNIYETEKHNVGLIATDKRCAILKSLIEKEKAKSKEKEKVKGVKEDATVTLYDNNNNPFLLSLDIEFVKQSATNKFITNSKIDDMCKNLSIIKVELMNVVCKAYNTVVKDFNKFSTYLEHISEFAAYIDVLLCKTNMAIKYNYCKPNISSENTKSFVNVKELRHCLIEKLQQTELYVTNDICLGSEYYDGMLLYGTNAVGKTSFIRALGISIILAQSGFYVPATSFTYKPYKQLFTRILGNDNIFKGQSTFVVEMTELSTILRLAGENSLIIGDELCSGTENSSATSIFVAGIQDISCKKASFIFATHLHEIAEYDEITSLTNVCMKHMSVVYNAELDCLVYDRRLKDGTGNNMYGLEVCKSLHMPSNFLKQANEIRMKYYDKSASILDHKQSRYNAKHITGGICEKCKINKAMEVHHLEYQQSANVNGMIVSNGHTFHKDVKANLMNLCNTCHDLIHKTNVKHTKVKTTKGTLAIPSNIPLKKV